MNIKYYLKKNYWIYNIYLFLFNRKYFRYRREELKFYSKFITSDSIVFDVGANIGVKSEVFWKLGARVISVEPDPTNFSNLLLLFKNRKKVTVLPYAIGSKNGISNFYIQQPGSAYNTMSIKWKDTLEDANVNRWKTITKFKESIEVETITLDTLIEKYGKPNFIKIDIEGFELPCFQGLNHKIEIISFEANLPEFKDETIQIIHHLEAIDSNVRFNYIFNDGIFEKDLPVTASYLISLLESIPIRYMEIYSYTSYKEEL